MASLIGADEDEILYTSGATEANNLALLGLRGRAMRGRRRELLISSIEHKCVIESARVMQDEHGHRVTEIPVDSEGYINLAALEEALSDEVLMVSVMAVNNEIGTIQNMERISELAREKGALVHCDAAQAPCALDISKYAEWVDMLSLSGHKMYGPPGVGCLYVSRHLQAKLEPIIYGGGQQNDLRSGTVPAFLCVGMATAADILQSQDAEVERQQIASLRDKFVKSLLELPWDIKINGPDLVSRHPGNANLQFKGFVAEDILTAVQPGVAASTGSACTSGIPEPSHVLMAIGCSTEEAEASIRFSIGRGITDADVDRAVLEIANVLARLDSANQEVLL